MSHQQETTCYLEKPETNNLNNAPSSFPAVDWPFLELTLEKIMLSRKTMKKTRVAKFAQKALTHKQMIVKASPKLDCYEREEAKYAAAYLKTLEKLTEHLLVFEDCYADFDPHIADRGKVGKYIDMLDRSIIDLTVKMEDKLIALTSKIASKSKSGKAVAFRVWNK